MSSTRTAHLNRGLIRNGNTGLIRGVTTARHGISPVFRIRATQLIPSSRTLTTSPRRYASPNLSPLEKQRLRRPVSPHITIYKWQYQSLTSILQRFSGMFLAGGIYVFAIGYLVAPTISPGLEQVFDLETIVSAAREVPGWAKSGGKFALALPFTYHFFNGVKHLMWDSGIGLAHKRLFGRFAWIVAGCSVVSSLGLAVL
ncbi:hypothetical protein TMatcc_001133 [Talaromyces marneffei ATCC 18224]|uniref:Succinate dehydrogenase, putative n=1 Tax=Talaromyces marneffei (strain ATCC 18224 / CBS 334.59 / QM 7333) TaxID=441960 RepID=B6QPB1_TALMQ|nr:succinate dehydrogenase, putative [Talaromyces marneffei ATCC 18224]